MSSPEEIAIDALRQVAKDQLVDDAGVFMPSASAAGLAVKFALHMAGQTEIVERTEPYSGARQVCWQGERLRDHTRPTMFDQAFRNTELLTPALSRKSVEAALSVLTGKVPGK